MILTQAWRSWRNSKAVAMLAAIALAAGIGSATAIYTVVNGVMLKPLPYWDGDRFVVLVGATLNDPEHMHLSCPKTRRCTSSGREFLMHSGGGGNPARTSRLPANHITCKARLSRFRWRAN